MHRRSLLGGAAALLIAPPLQARGIVPRRIMLRHAHTGARFEGVWHNGIAPDRIAMDELSTVLSDSPTIRPRPFDPEALGILWQVANAARLGPELVVRSGFRTPAINRAVHGAGDSQHLRAGALDVEVPAGRIQAVAEAALRLRAGGVGVYPSRGFIHLDSGPVRHWTGGGDGVVSARAGQRRGGQRLDLDAADPIARIAEAWRGGR